MNTAQLEIINDQTNSTIVVLAAPGAGKTATLVARVVECAKRSDPRQFAVITFTNAASKELCERVEKANPGLRLGYVGTLHGWAMKIVKAHGKLLGLPESFSLIDEEQQEDILETIKLQHGYKGTKKAIQEAVAKSVWLNATIETHAERVAADFHQQMRQSGTYTFDSLLVYCAMLLEKDGHCAPSPTYLFVDEVQDSSAMDFRIYTAMECFVKFLIGDQRQAIYGFRGGDVNQIRSIAHRFDVKTYSLTQNYRSGRNICQAANRLITHNPGSGEDIVAANDYDGEIDVMTSPNSISSLQQIALDICDNNASEKEFDSTAVLFRYNAHVDEAVKYFESQNIPLARRAEVTVPPDWRQAKALLAVLANPYNEVTMNHYLKVAYGSEEAKKIAAEAAAKFMPVNDYRFHFKTDGSSWPDDFRTQGISMESMAKVTASRGDLIDPTIPELIHALSTEPARQTHGQGLVVTTMHGAKGLEFDCVYIGAAEQALMPGQKDGAALEEERRLFYVAITRAKRRLVLCHAAFRANAFGNKRAVEQQPSQFIKEMGI